MLKRKWLWITVPFILFLAAAGTISLSSYIYSKPGPTKANFKRITNGMTLPDVERILGGPPSIRYLTPEEAKRRASSPFFTYCSGRWSCPDARYFIDVIVDNEDRVVGTDYVAPPSLLDKVVGWLRIRFGTSR
jgi:hypothetical protein